MGSSSNGVLRLSPNIPTEQQTSPEQKSINHTLALTPHWVCCCSHRGSTFVPSLPEVCDIQQFFKGREKAQLNNGTNFHSFAVGASLGAHSFRNKCPINNGHSTPQGRGVKSGEGGYEGKRAREECVASGKRGAEMRGEVENEKCREFSYSHI